MINMSEQELNKLQLLGIDVLDNVGKGLIDLNLSEKYKSYDILITLDKNILVKDPYNLHANIIKDEIEGNKICLIPVFNFENLKDYIISENASLAEIFRDNSDEKEELELDNTEISKIINNILNSAKNRNASDIHISPKEDRTEIKFREDGELRTAQTHPSHYAAFIVNKLKNESRMDISNKLIPQDGKLKVKVDGELLELRISTLPTVFGENAVIRVQRPENFDEKTLDSSGFEEEELASYREKFREANGLILNVGGTGTGKSTTFAVTIGELIKTFPYKNIVTVEDPVEMKNPLISQVEVNEKQGRTFASVLRSFMRQDPDIILIGEIRDQETATIGVQAALTGHLVLATLHANDSFDAITRLREMGVEDQIISATGSCFLSQVLVKKLCDHCKEEYTLTNKEIDELDLDFNKAYKAVGCSHCEGKGYIGREAAIEVLSIDQDIKHAISAGLTSVEIKKMMKKKGFSNLWANTLKKIQAGVTTFDELRSKVKRDVIFNFKSEEGDDIDTRIIFYPETKLEAKISKKSCRVFDISKRGISFVFDVPTFLNIGRPVEAQINNETFVDFIPKGYGKIKDKFIVSGIYNGDLKEYLED